MPYVKQVSKNNLRADLPELRSGQTVAVHQRITEGDKERIQVFEGQVIAVKHGRGLNATFTVRKIASGVGVERIFPMHAPTIAKIEVVKDVAARQSKLYHTRKGATPKLKPRKSAKK